MQFECFKGSWDGLYPRALGDVGGELVMGLRRNQAAAAPRSSCEETARAMLVIQKVNGGSSNLVCTCTLAIICSCIW
jgi:hypothetical protein